MSESVNPTGARNGELHDSTSQELAALGHLVARTTHDFNNILTVIMGYADLALQKRLPSDTNSEDLIQIKKATERAGFLVCRLLAFSEPERNGIDPKIIKQDASH